MSRSAHATPDVAIVGAGPYGLSLSAHLSARGVEHRIFGEPMSVWREHMPKGMFLKSDGFASNLDEPEGRFTLARYCAQQSIAYADEGLPVGLDVFCGYGLAFKQHFVPHLERKRVTRLWIDAGRWSLELDDGETLRPRRIVLATGISAFEHVPPELAGLAPQLCSHSAACNEPTRFAGRDVTVIGSGASAVDVAALLHDGGARVQLIARKQALAFHAGPSSTPRSLWQRLSEPKSGLGPSLRSLLYSEAPQLFHHLPQHTRLRIARNYLGPAGGWFMRERVFGKLSLLLGMQLQQAQIRDGRVHLHLRAADGATREVVTDHVIAATGYRVDLRRLQFLDDGVRQSLRMIDYTPILSAAFETSLAGLHVIGPAAANSFGPVMRFVFGARFAARRLSSHLARTALRRLAPGHDAASAREVAQRSPALPTEPQRIP